MHTFTQQQRQGGVKYAAKTLVGNWSEDLDLHAASMKDFLLRKQTKSLQVDRFQERLQVALQPVELTTVRDCEPWVHFGDVLQLLHLNTGSVLAVDIDKGGELSCAASATSELLQPVARNTLLLTKYRPSRPTPLEPQWADDVLRYGQKIRLVANPMAQGEPVFDARGGNNPLALFSRPLGATCAARFSRHQLVGFTWTDSYDSVWQVAAIDPADRLASEGVEVAAGAPILLIHCATQAPLNLEEGVAHPNAYGLEAEVSAHGVTSAGKQLSLEHAARGETSRCLPKPQLSSNHWTFVTGSTVAELPAVNHSSVSALERLLPELRQQLDSRPGARATLEQKLVRLANADGCLITAELLMAIRQVGCDLSEDDAADIAAELAATAAAAATGRSTNTSAGKVNIRVFLEALTTTAADDPCIQ